MQLHLLWLARQGIVLGLLPPEPLVAYGGTSSGATCALCAVSINSGAPDIELTWRSELDRTELALLHPKCFLAWRGTVSTGGPLVRDFE